MTARRIVLPITAASCPRLFALCVSVLLDNGAVNREEPYPVAIRLPFRSWHPVADTLLMEMVLASMPEADRETLAIGEDTDAKAVSRRYGLESLARVLDAWFELGMPCDRTPA